MNPFYPILFCSVLALPFPVENVHAQVTSQPEATPFSLSESVHEALEKNPAIQSARKSWDAMKARIPQARAWDDPKVSFEENLGRFVSVQRNAFADQNVSAEQAIPISGKNEARGRAAYAEAVLAYERMRRQEVDVAAAVTSAYYQLADAYAQIELNRKNLVSLQQIEEVSRARYGSGDEGAVFVLMAQTESSKLLEAARDLDLEAATEQSKLNVLMGRDAFVPIGQPTDTFATPAIPSVNTLRELTLKYRPEVRMAEARIEQEKALLQLAHREWIPDPAINVQGQRYNGAAQGISEVDAGISFNVPWVNARKYSAEVAEAGDNLQAARADAQLARNEAVGMLREALEKVETSHHHLELFRDKLVPQAQQAFDASQIGYEAGKLSFNDWIAAQHSLRDLQSMERQHLTDYEVSFAELEAVIGCDLLNRLPIKDPVP